MANFQYTALDAKGEQTDGVVSANSEAEAIQQLRGKGLYPTQIADEGKGSKKSKRAPAKQRRCKEGNVHEEASFGWGFAGADGAPLAPAERCAGMRPSAMSWAHSAWCSCAQAMPTRPVRMPCAAPFKPSVPM